MIYALHFLALALLLVFQLGLAGSGWIWVPHMALVYLTCLGAGARPPKQLWIMAIAAGIALDFFSGTVDGTMLLGMLAGVFGSRYVFSAVFPHNLGRAALFLQIGLSLILFFAAASLAAWILSAAGFGGGLAIEYIWSRRLAQDLIATLVLGYPVSRLYHLVESIGVRNQS